jgi:hypothetical protein
MKKHIILGAVGIILASAITWALEDTPANRSREAERLISRDRIEEGMQQAIDHMAQVIPTGLRKNFNDQMIMSIDISALERAMREAMIKRFTADEMQAFADSGASSVGGSLEEKREAYTLEVMHAFSQTLDAGFAKVSPEIAKWVLEDGRLGLRVSNFYSAIANNDLNKRYEMESVAIRHRMTLEEWKKDAGFDKPQRQSTVKILQENWKRSWIAVHGRTMMVSKRSDAAFSFV